LGHEAKQIKGWQAAQINRSGMRVGIFATFIAFCTAWPRAQREFVA
jgi:hypothetical protein